MIEPGPALLITTGDGDQAGIMTNGFNMPVRHDGLLAVMVGPWDASYETLARTRECVLGVPGVDLLETTVDIGNCSSAEVDKWETFGLHQLPATTVRAPLIGECVANIECTVEDDTLAEDYHLWILRAQAVWLDQERPQAPEIHYRGDGTFSENGAVHDLRHRMTRWPHLV